MNLETLGLTPAQLGELEQADPLLVAAWLEHVATALGVRSPAGLVLSGVRSGNRPQQETGEQERKAFIQAERYIRQVGYLHQSEQELRDELVYRKWPVDDRLLELWRLVRPIGERTEREQLERAERWKAHARMQELATDATSDADANIAW